MRNLRTGLFLVVAVAFVSQPSVCWACSCPKPISETEYYERADAVFVGVVIERHPSDPGDQQSQVTWTIDVEGVSKGEVPDPQEVKSREGGSLCGYPFKVGQRYKVYAEREADGSLSTTSCSGTRLSEESPATQPPPATNSPSPESTQPPPATNSPSPVTALASPQETPSPLHHASPEPSIDASAKSRDIVATSETKGGVTLAAVAAALTLLLTAGATGWWLWTQKRGGP